MFFLKITFIFLFIILLAIVPLKALKRKPDIEVREIFQIYNIVRVGYGLGNQMFRYAFAYALQYETNVPVYMELTYFKDCRNHNCMDFCLNNVSIDSTQRTFSLCYYNITLTQATNRQINSVLPENKYSDRDVLGKKLSEFKGKSQYFSGPYENLGFYDFEKYRPHFLREFAFKGQLVGCYKDYLSLIERSNSVSVHFRRTDHIYSSATNQYYIDAINYMNKHVDNPHYFIFSDDLKYIKANVRINGSHTYIECKNQNSVYDFELMRHCKHNIMAVSTYSWWAAYLNENKDKIVVAPKYWGRRKSDFLVPEYYVTL